MMDTGDYKKTTNRNKMNLMLAQPVDRGPKRERGTDKIIESDGATPVASMSVGRSNGKEKKK